MTTTDPRPPAEDNPPEAQEAKGEEEPKTTVLGAVMDFFHIPGTGLGTKKRILACVIIGCLLLVFGVFKMVIHRDSGHTTQITVAIVHTHLGKGIRARTAPSKSSPQVGAVLYDNTNVTVVCQTRSGEAWSEPGEGRPIGAVSAWDQLADGNWIPDIFTDLKGKYGASPPKGVLKCPEDDR